jgi:phosphoribosylpyrophosphate synthetase
MMMEQGATSVRAVCTHAVLSGEAYERIERSALTELIVSDTIPWTLIKASIPTRSNSSPWPGFSPT